MVNFVLSQFNTEISMDTLGESNFDITVQDLSFNATGVMYVKTSNMKEVFKYATGCDTINDLSNSDILYYVYSYKFDNMLDLNPAHAMMDVSMSENAILTEDMNGELLPSNKMLIKHDFIRYVSLKLFNTGYGVDLFANEEELSQNMSLNGGISYSSFAGYQILNSLFSVDVSGVNPNGTNENLIQDPSGLWCMTDADTSEQNICRELFYQLGKIDKNRILNNVQDTTFPQSIPFEDGDTIMFTMNISAADNQEKLTGLSSTIPDRTYRIKMILVADDSLLENTTVVDATTYTYNLVTADISGGATSSSDSSTNTIDFSGDANRSLEINNDISPPPIIRKKQSTMFDILEGYVCDILGSNNPPTTNNLDESLGSFNITEDVTDEQSFVSSKTNIQTQNGGILNTRDISLSYTSSFSLDSDLLVKYIIIGGGGGGGGGAYGSSLYSCGGAGGGGGQIVTGSSLLKANVSYSITIGAGGEGGTGGEMSGTSGQNGSYSSFIDVSALGGLGGNGGVNLTDNVSLVGGYGYSYKSSIIGSGGNGVNGNTTHDIDARIGQYGVSLEYSTNSIIIAACGGAGGTSPAGFVSAINSLGGGGIGGSGAVGGLNGVAGSAGTKNTGSGGGGGGASPDYENITYTNGYSGGSGRVIIWYDKYIVTDTLYNTNLFVADLSSTALSVKYLNYYSPATKFNTSWYPNTIGSYCSSTTSDYVEIYGLTPNTEYTVYGTVESALGTSISVYAVYSTPPIKPVITLTTGQNQLSVLFDDSMNFVKNSYNLIWTPNTINSYSYIVDSSYIVIAGLKDYTQYGVSGFVTTNGLTSAVSNTITSATKTIVTSFSLVSYTATTAEFAWDGSFAYVVIIWSDTSLYGNIRRTSTLYGNTGGVTGLNGNQIRYFKAVPYSDIGITGVESSTVSFRTLPRITTFYATLYTLSSIIINWDGSYSMVKADWGTTSDLSGSYKTLSGITENYMVATDLSIGVLYYFRVTPKNADGLYGSASTIIPMATSYMPTITSLTTASLSTSSISLTWDGSYSLVNISVSTDSSFSSIFYSVSSLNASTKTITGMTAGTKYYFSITPHGTGFVGPVSTITTADTIPQLTGYSVTSYDSSSVLVGWTGSVLNGTLVWNTSGTFSLSDSSMNGISGVSSSQRITGLTSNQIYYVKMIPYTTSNVNGTFVISGTTTSFKTLFAITRPIVNTFSTSTITASTVLLTWSGVLTSVDIYWDTSGTFIGSAGLSAITGTTRTITGLSSNTKYYFKIIPKSSASEYGVSSSILNITTLPIINTFTSSAVDTSAISLVFTGGFSTVDVFWNTANDFSTTYSSTTGITSSPFVVSGLSPNILYYFKITPYSSINEVGATNLTNNITKPRVSSFDVSITDCSTAVLTWNGYLNTTDILWNKTGSTFDSTSNRLYSVSGLTKTIVGLDSSSTYYFLIVPYNASSVVGVSSDVITKTTYYYPLITSSAVSATDSSSVAITYAGLYSYANITWNTTNVITDVSFSLINQTSSPVIISGLLSNTKYYFTITPYYTLPSSLVITGSTLKLGDLSSTINSATPVLISAGSYFSFTTSNYTNAVVSGSTGNYAYTNGTYAISYSSQMTTTSFAAVNAFNLYNSSLNWAAASGTYNTSGVYTGITATFSSSMTISGEYIGIQLPYGLVVKDYNIARIISTPTYNATSYALVGSVNGMNWKTLDKQTLPSVDASYSYTLPSNTKSYNYYRFIAIAGSTSNSQTTAGIRQLKLNGYTRTLDISGVVNTTTLAKITSFAVTPRNNSSAIVTYDGSYSNINVLWNTTGVFNTSLYSSSISVVDNPYTVTSLLSNTKYYFALTPVSNSGVSGSNSSILNITTNPFITSFDVSPDTSSSLQMVWDGSFSNVNIYWNTTNSESVFDGSYTGLTTKTSSLSGLTSNTTYYFYMIPYNSIGMSGEITTIYATTLPVLTSSSLIIIDLTSVKISWTGIYNSVSIKYGVDPSFISITGSLTGIQGTSASIYGLASDTKYYFKLTSYNIENNVGTIIMDLSLSLSYYPVIRSFVATPVDISTISLAFDGSYSDIYIQWNDSNVFTALDNSASMITANTYTLTNLQSNKTYYIGRTPFLNTSSGRFSGTSIVAYDISTAIVGITPIPTTNSTTYATFSSNALTVSGNMTYANGNYAVSSSSQFNTTIWNAYSVFNSESAYGWLSKNGQYDLSNNGNYIGTTSTQLVSGTSISGEWVQIQMPYYSVATSYMIGAISSINNLNCSVFSLVGSVNGTAWYLLDSKTRTTQSALYIGDISSNIYSYKYYRFIATKCDPSAVINATGLNNLIINGRFSTRTQNDVVSTTTYSKLTSYSVSSVYDTTAVLTWDGSLSSIKVEWNYTGNFSGTNSSVTGLTGNTTTITGLLPSSTVYMRIIPYSSSSLIGAYSDVFNVSTLSSVSSSTASISLNDIYAVDLSFVGVYSTVKIQRNTTAIFSNETVIASDISANTYKSSGLQPNTKYYFRITSYNASNVAGSYSDCSITTFPLITTASIVSKTSSDVSLSFDGSFSSVSIKWDTNPLFTTSGNIVAGITGNTGSMSGLMSNKLYYFKIIPSNGVVVGASSDLLTTTTKSKITSVVATSTDVSIVSLVWDGSYSTVSVQWDTSSNFVTNDNSINNLMTTNTVIRGLSANTKYYFRVLSYSSSSEFGGYSNTCNAVTYPQISTFGGTYTSSAEVSLNWTGALSTVSILQNTTGSFSPFTGVTTSDVSGLTAPVSGLLANMNYYFLLKPYSSVGTMGISSDVIQIRTKPAITTITSTVVDVSSLTVSWDGSYSSVDLLWNTTGTFYVSDSSLSGLTMNTQTITGLLDGTTYYFIVVPKTVAGVSGNNSTVSSVTTVAEASITTTSSTVLGVSSATIAWSGLYNTIDVQWATDASFTTIYGRANGLTTNSYTIQFLDANTTYYYRIIPYYNITARRVNTVYSFKTDYLPLISSLVVSASDTSGVVLSWDGSFSTVKIRRNITGIFDISDTVVSNVSKNSSPYTISGLSSADTYYFRIKGYNVVGDSSLNSSIVSAVTGYDSSYQFVTADASVNNVVVARNIDSSGILFVTVSGETSISTLGITSETASRYYIVKNYSSSNEFVIPLYFPTITNASSSVIDNSSVSLTWDGSFTSVNIQWSSVDSSLSVIDCSINSIAGSSAVIRGLSDSTTYYYRIYPKLFNIVNNTINVSTRSFMTYFKPTITSFSATTTDISTIALAWDGSFSSVDIYRCLTSSFDTINTIISGISANTYSITDLSANTQYYFKLKTRGVGGYIYTDSSSVSVFTDYLPYITDSYAYAIDTSSITIGADGSFSIMNILWNSDDSGIFNNTINDISSQVYTLTGLSQDVSYNFKIIPFNLTGYQGADGSVVTSRTAFTPIIYSKTLTVLTDSSIRVDWTGLFTVVDIQLSLTDSFEIITNEYNDLTGNNYTIEDLIPETTYKVKIIPYFVGSIY